MSKPAIQIQGLGKQYNRQGSSSGATLREWLSTWGKPRQQDPFWALRDLDLTVEQGEILGVIGRNGSGKSTLLKLLSRITPPTTGVAKINGRVASLLEVGTGFHHELSGRENIYLNGAILGMTREEVKEQFAAIVEFAGVEDFIEAKVKQYSSGMYVRLAFSVAAHLRTDILLVDEVLAVGDAEFQQKSLAKMNEVVRDNGRTILFVSHNLGLVQQLCGRGILLDQGKLISEGTAASTIQCYHQHINGQVSQQIVFTGPLKNRATLKRILVNQQTVGEDLFFAAENDLYIQIELDFALDKEMTTFGLGVFRNGMRLATLYCVSELALTSQRQTLVFIIQQDQLAAGYYSFGFGGRWNDAAESWFWNENLFGITITANQLEPGVKHEQNMISLRYSSELRPN